MTLELITAQLATIPGRESILKDTVTSLYDQVDQLTVVFNGHNAVPNWWANFPRAVAILKDKNMGDAEKFFNVEHRRGYIFTADDDIIYPPDYISKMIEAIEYFDRECIITNHGRSLMPRPIQSYYSTKYRIKRAHCEERVDEDIEVEFPGTGVCGWHHSTIPDLSYSDFREPNMGDIWLAIACRWLPGLEKRRPKDIPIIVNRHEAGWIEAQMTPDETIWEQHYGNDKLQTEIVNKWM
jgi:hypothetical protein